MEIPPSMWGPFFWNTMHIIALGYSSTPTYGDKKAAKEFFESLLFLIPCPICKKHYTDFLQEMPITPFLDNRSNLFKWTVMLHNKVNQTLGKPQFTESDSINYYKRLSKTNRSPVFTGNDFAVADLRATIKGVGIGVSSVLVIGTVLWYLSKDYIK